MRRLFALLLIFALLCGCAGDAQTSAAPSASAAPNARGYGDFGELETLGSVYLTTGGADATDYTVASLRAEWDGFTLSEQVVQVRWRGNSSSDHDKKSYNVKFDSAVPLLGMAAGKKWTLIASPFDRSLVRISVGFDYAKAIGLDYASDTRLFKMYIDGRYYGIYNAVEPIQAKTERVDIDTNAGDFIIERDIARWKDGVSYFETDGLRFEMGEPDTPKPSQVDAAQEFIHEVVEALKTKDEAVYGQLIDIDSFVDFYIFQELVKDIDFGNYSTRYYKKDGKLYAGPPWDLDLTMGNVSAQIYDETDYQKYATYHNKDGFGTNTGDSAHGYWANQGDFYQWLCKDNDFMALVRARWSELHLLTENLVRWNDLGDSLIDRYLFAYGDEFALNYSQGEGGAGWPINVNGYYAEQEYELTQRANVERLRGWLERRIEWLDVRWLNK